MYQPPRTAGPWLVPGIGLVGLALRVIVGTIGLDPGDHRGPGGTEASETSDHEADRDRIAKQRNVVPTHGTSLSVSYSPTLLCPFPMGAVG